MSDSDVPGLTDSSCSDDEYCHTYDDRMQSFVKQSCTRNDRLLMLVYCKSPVMFGVNKQSETWLRFLHEAKLIPTLDVNEHFHRHIAMNDKEMAVANALHEGMELVQRDAIKKEMLKDFLQLFRHCGSSVFTEVTGNQPPRPLDAVLHDARSYEFLHRWKDEILQKHRRAEGSPPFCLDDRQVVVCLLYAARQYAKYALDVINDDVTAPWNQFEFTRDTDNEAILEKKEKGNACFWKKDYTGAVAAYTEAIKRSRYNPILYGNRAQSFIYSKKYAEALSDSLRSVTLDPTWHKGYYRCAQALYDMGRVKEALDMCRKGLSKCPGDKSLKEQKTRFELQPRVQRGFNHTDADGDDCPELTSSDSDVEDPLRDRLETAREEKLARQKETQDKMKDDIRKKEEKIRKEEQEKSRKREEDRRKEAKRKEEEGKRKEHERKEKAAKDKVRREEEEKQRTKEENEALQHEKESRYTQLYDFLADGTRALLDSRASNAHTHFNRALDFLQKYGFNYFDRIVEIDLIVLQYSIGVTCVFINTSKEIQHGINIFREILSKYESVNFPLAYLGLGRAFLALFRFSEALEPLTKGLSVVRNMADSNLLTWPGTKTSIEDTRPGMLKCAFDDLIVRCRYPPKPDAVCRYNWCLGHCAGGGTNQHRSYYSVHIYISNPDLRGFVRLRCVARCRIEYHLDCWRKLKKDKISSQDKDYLNYPCFTNDCGEKITEITIYDQNGIDTKNLKSPKVENFTKPTKPVNRSKMKVTNQTRIAKQAERKAKRKEIRAQQRLERQRASEQASGANAIYIIESLEKAGPPSPSQLLQLSPVLVLKKDSEEAEDAPVRQKKTGKKRKENQKMTMHLEEFVGRDESVYEDENGVLHKFPASLASQFTQPPPPLAVNYSNVLSGFSAPYDAWSTDTIVNEMTSNLMSYFKDILQEHGPLFEDDTILRHELDELPPDAGALIARSGGLAFFLTQSLDFARIEGVVCLLKDSVKASEIAFAPRTEQSSTVSSLYTNNTSSSSVSISQPQCSVVSSSSVFESVSVPLSSSKAPLTSQLMDSSQGGFPNSFNVAGAKNVSNPSASGDDLFADLNFPKKNKSGLCLDELDSIDFPDDKPYMKTFSNPPPLRTTSVPTFSQVPLIAKETTRDSATLSDTRYQSSAKNTLDDIDDVSDITSSEGRRSEVRSSNGQCLSSLTSDYLRSLKELRRPSLKSHDGSESGSVAMASPKPIGYFNGDIAQLDDFETYSMPTSDVCDDVNESTSSLARNYNHIQELKQFSASLSRETGSCTNSPKPLAKVFSYTDFPSKVSSPSNSVASWPNQRKPNTNLQVNPVGSLPLNDSHGDNHINSEQKSRLTDWLKSPIGDVKPNADTGILSGAVFWNKKKLDLASLENMGSVVSSDEDDLDATKPDQSGDIRMADREQSPAQMTDSFSPSPVTRPSPSAIQNVRVSPPPGLGVSGSKASYTQSGLLTQNTDREVKNAGSKYGAIGSRTDLTADSPGPSGAVSSRASSKPGTPAHTPSSTPRPSATESLAVFPSAHDSAALFPAINFSAPPPPASNSFGIAVPIVSNQTNGHPLFANNPIGGGLLSTLFQGNEKTNGWPMPNDIKSNSPEPLDGVDYDDVIKEENAKIDREFIHDITTDTYNRLKDSDTFKDNPDLYKQIEQDVRNDLETSRCKSSQWPRRSSKFPKQTETDGCNTNPYEPNRDVLDMTNARYSELMDRYSALKNQTTVEIRDLKTRLESSELESQQMNAKCRSAVERRDAEMRRWQGEKRHLADELDSLRQQHSATKSVGGNLHAELLQTRAVLDKLTLDYLHETESHEVVKAHLNEELDLMRVRAAENLARAKKSEIKFLNLQVSVGLQILESSLRDCQMRQLQFGHTMQRMIESNKPISPHYENTVAQWQQNEKIIQEMQQKYKSEHEKHIEAILNGTPLSVLPEIGLPKPPPAPTGVDPNMLQYPPIGIPIVPPPSVLQNGTSSPQPTRSASTASPVVSAPNYPLGLVRSAVDMRRQKGKGSYNRLLEILCQRFPGYKRDEFAEHIRQLREERGSLSGLTMDGIVQSVRERLQRRRTPSGLRGTTLEPSPSVWGIPGARNGVLGGGADSPGAGGEEAFCEEEDLCLICFEEIEPHNTMKLECQHRFHGACISKWFQQNRTCPTCRNHALLPEEFPRLG